MKVTLRTIIDSADGAKKLGTLKLKAKFAYELSKSIEIIEKEHKAFTAIRNKKIKEYGVENKQKRGTYTFEGDSQVKLQQDLDNLLDKELDLNMEKFSINELKDVDFEANILRKLSWLIKG